MDWLVSFFFAELIPGLVFHAEKNATSVNGGARITSALAAIGPGGMTGGLISLGAIQAATLLLAKGSVDIIYIMGIRQLSKEGIPAEMIFEAIDRYPVSSGLKQRLRNKVAQLQNGHETNLERGKLE